MTEFEKLLPFAIRAGMPIAGRYKLSRLAKKLAFVWITEDLSENSVQEVKNSLRFCPVIRFGNVDYVTEQLHFNNTKIIGFKKSSISNSLLKALKEAEHIQ